jgi:hypothetical protein
LKLKLSTSEVNDNRLETICDANWGEDRSDRKSNSGYVMQLNGGTIAWCCRKQNIVTLSSAEAEYVAMTEAAKEAIWIRNVMKQICDQKNQPLRIHTDSQSAMAMTEKQNFSNRTKHVDIKYHFIKDLIRTEQIKLEYVPTETNIADMMTKPLGANRIRQLREMAGLKQSHEDQIEEEC